MGDGDGRPDGERTRVGRMLLDALRRVLAAAERGERVGGVIDGPKPEIPRPDTGTFADGVTAERELRRHLGIDAETKELGESRPQDQPGRPDRPRLPEDVVLSVGDTTHVLRFPYFQAAFFAWLDPGKVRNLRKIAALDAEILDAITAVGRREIERRIIRRTWRRARRWAVAAVVGSFLAAHWFADQLAWIVERLPVLREFWTWITGGSR